MLFLVSPGVFFLVFSYLGVLFWCVIFWGFFWCAMSVSSDPLRFSCCLLVGISRMFFGGGGVLAGCYFCFMCYSGCCLGGVPFCGVLLVCYVCLLSSLGVLVWCVLVDSFGVFFLVCVFRGECFGVSSFGHVHVWGVLLG